MPKTPKRLLPHRSSLDRSPPIASYIEQIWSPTWGVCVALALSMGLVYGRALDAPFIFDDSASVTENVSILSLWPLIGTTEHRGPFNPGPELPTSGRPLVNLSFALNYYFG